MRRIRLGRLFPRHYFGLEHYHSDEVAIIFYWTAGLLVILEPLYGVPDVASFAAAVLAAMVLVALGIIARPTRTFVTTLHAFVASGAFIFFQIWGFTMMTQQHIAAGATSEFFSLLFGVAAVLSFLTIRSYKNGAIRLDMLHLEEKARHAAIPDTPAEIIRERERKERMEEAQREDNIYG